MLTLGFTSNHPPHIWTHLLLGRGRAWHVVFDYLCACVVHTDGSVSTEMYKSAYVIALGYMERLMCRY